MNKERNSNGGNGSGGNLQRPPQKLDQAQLKNLQSLKRKMMRVKEGAKVCKKFLSKQSKLKNKESNKNLKVDKTA